jgi:P27 family predicted phage terminase small subunit
VAISGRKPKPVEQRRREGNPRQHKAPEPVLVAGRPMTEELAEAPEHLPAHAKKFWKDAIVRLADVGILDRVDTATLELMAMQYARARQAADVIEREGLMSEGSKGQPRPHPAVQIERLATADFLRIAEHFALTPVARTRLGLAELERRKLEDDIEQSVGKPKLKQVASGNRRRLSLANNRRRTE